MLLVRGKIPIELPCLIPLIPGGLESRIYYKGNPDPNSNSNPIPSILDGLKSRIYYEGRLRLGYGLGLG
jgi:hypothetical protein